MQVLLAEETRQDVLPDGNKGHDKHWENDPHNLQRLITFSQIL